MAAGLGWLVLTLLTAIAFLDAVLLARRTGPAGRAELGIVTTCFFFALLATPTLILGYLGWLTPTSLGLFSFALFAGVFVILARGRNLRARLGESLDWTRVLATMPFDGLREAARARSVVFLGLAWCALLIVMAAVFTYLVGFASWDGFMYHEPIVGFAIQNHGFELVSLPPQEAVQSTNGYPRLSESLSLWFVIFTDRTFIELPVVLGSPPLMWAVYALARRYTDRLAAMGWSTVFFLVPHVWHALGSTYIDVAVGFATLTAIYFATRPVYRMRDAWMASIAMALVSGSKHSWVLFLPPVALVATVRLLLHFVRRRPAAVLGTIAGGLTLVVGLAACTHVRDWIAFRNPFWPIAYDNAKLGVSWPGLIRTSNYADPPAKDLFDAFTDTPRGGIEDVIHRPWGMAVTWIVVPICVVALVVAAFAVVVELLRWRRGLASNLWITVFPGLLALKTSPALLQPRYTMHLIVALMLPCAWLLRRPAWLRAREGVVASGIVLSLLPFFWIKDAYPASADELKERLTHPFAPRAYSHHPGYDLLCRERDAELGKGDRVAFDKDVVMVAALWNFEFSNRVRYIPFSSSDQYLAAISAYDPKWIAAGAESSARATLERTGHWELVGRLVPSHDSIVLRKKP